MSKVFFDTNVLAYACDRDSPEKRRIACELIETGTRSGNMVISTQVLHEFYVTAVSKLRVSPLYAKSLIHSYLMGNVVMIDPYDTVRAVWQYTLADLVLGCAYRDGCDESGMSGSPDRRSPARPDHREC